MHAALSSRGANLAGLGVSQCAPLAGRALSLLGSRVKWRGLQRALSFDGIGGYVGCPLATTSIVNVTMEAWFKTLDPSQAGQMVFFNGSDATATGYGFAVNKEQVTNGHVYLLRSGVAWLDTGYVVDTKWHFGCLVIGAASEFSFYLDAILISGPTGGSLHVPSLKTEIGRNDFAAARYFFGPIRGARIYKRPLSLYEIAEHYRGIFSNGDGLVGRWDLDEADDIIAHDKSGYGNHGRLVGNPQRAQVFSPDLLT